MKKCGCTKPCGCSNDIVSQAPACTGYPSCDSPEVCSETFDARCTIYTGPEIAKVADSIYIPKGARVDEIIQRLTGAIVNPGCNFGNSPCLSVLVTVEKITTTTIKLNWGSVGTGLSYVVQYKLPSSPNWISLPAVTTLYDTIGGLTTGTAYEVRVQTVCTSTCNSLTFSITTS